jgi:hypothetical protein
MAMYQASVLPVAHTGNVMVQLFFVKNDTCSMQASSSKVQWCSICSLRSILVVLLAIYVCACTIGRSAGRRVGGTRGPCSNFLQGFERFIKHIVFRVHLWPSFWTWTCRGASIWQQVHMQVGYFEFGAGLYLLEVV